MEDNNQEKEQQDPAQMDMFAKGSAMDKTFNEAMTLTIRAEDNDFEGAGYERKQDHARLSGQMLQIWTLMKGGTWNTLKGIELATGFPQASISASLRNFRKQKWGGHQVERKRKEHAKGTWLYKLTPRPGVKMTR